MKKHLWTLLLAAVVISFSSCTKKSETDSAEIAEDQNEAKFEETNLEQDTEFAIAAATGGLLEVRLGELAAASASSQQVKDFARQMVTDHGKANDELKDLAARKNISIPAALDEKGKEKYDELAKKTGTEFDQAYADFMVDDHKEDIDAFQREADNGSDPDLKAWAAEKIPVLQHHLSMAKTMKEAVKNAANNTSSKQ